MPEEAAPQPEDKGKGKGKGKGKADKGKGKGKEEGAVKGAEAVEVVEEGQERGRSRRADSGSGCCCTG